MTTPILRVRIDTAQISRLASVVEKAVKNAAEKAVRSNKRIIESMNTELAKSLAIQRKQLSKQTKIASSMASSGKQIKSTNALLRQTITIMNRLAKSTKDTRTRLIAVGKVSDSLRLTTTKIRREQGKISSALRRTQKFLRNNLRTRKQNARAAKDTAQATRSQGSSLAKMPSALGAINGIFGRILGVAKKVGRVLAIVSGVTFVGILFAMKKWLSDGIALNAEFQAMEIGVAATLAANTKILDVNKKQLTGVQAVIAAQGVSLATQNKLIAAAFRSGQSLQEFVQAFRIALPLITKVGGSVEDTIDIVKRLSLAAAAIGIPMTLVRIQIDDLTKGVVTTRTLLAQVLGITQEQLRLEKERGNLIGFLKERTQAFLDAQTLLESKFNIQIGKLKLISELAAMEATKSSFRIILDIVTSITSKVAEINAFTGKFSLNIGFQNFLTQMDVVIASLTKVFFRFLTLLPNIIVGLVNILTRFIASVSPDLFIDPKLSREPGTGKRTITETLLGPAGGVAVVERQTSEAEDARADFLATLKALQGDISEGASSLSKGTQDLLESFNIGDRLKTVVNKTSEEVIRSIDQLSNAQKAAAESVKLVSDFNELVAKQVADTKRSAVIIREELAPAFLKKLEKRSELAFREISDPGLTPGQQVASLIKLVETNTKEVGNIVASAKSTRTTLEEVAATIKAALALPDPRVAENTLQTLLKGIVGEGRVIPQFEAGGTPRQQLRALQARVGAEIKSIAPLSELISVAPKPEAPSPTDIRKRQKEIDLVARAVDAETKANLRLILAQNKLSEGNRVLTAIQQGAAKTVVNNLEAEINLKNVLFDLDTIRALEDIKGVTRRADFAKARKGDRDAQEAALRLQQQLNGLLKEASDVTKDRLDTERQRITLLTRSIDIERSLSQRRARLAIVDEIKLTRAIERIDINSILKRDAASKLSGKERVFEQEKNAQEIAKLQAEADLSVDEIRTKRAKNFIRSLDEQIRASARRMAEGFGRAFDALITRGKNAFEKFSSFLRSIFLGIGRSLVENLLQGLFEGLLARLREKFKGKGILSQILRSIFGITIPKITAKEMQIVNDIEAKKLIVDDIVMKTQPPPIFGERDDTVHTLASLFSGGGLDSLLGGERGGGLNAFPSGGGGGGFPNPIESLQRVIRDVKSLFVKPEGGFTTGARVGGTIAGVTTAISGLKQGGPVGFGKSVLGGAVAGFFASGGNPVVAAIGAIIGGVSFGLKALFTRGETAEERAEKIKEAAERNLFVPPDPFAFERANLPGLPSVAGTSLGNLVAIPSSAQNLASSPEFINVNLTLDGRIISNSLIKLGSGGDRIRRFGILDAN